MDATHHPHQGGSIRQRTKSIICSPSSSLLIIKRLFRSYGIDFICVIKIANLISIMSSSNVHTLSQLRERAEKEKEKELERKKLQEQVRKAYSLVSVLCLNVD